VPSSASPDNSASNQFNIGNLIYPIYGTGLGSGVTIGIGNIGIATTNPWGRLSIKGSGTGKALVITDGANVERMIVQDNGNLGSGTSGPQFDVSMLATKAETLLPSPLTLPQRPQPMCKLATRCPMSARLLYSSSRSGRNGLSAMA